MSFQRRKTQDRERSFVITMRKGLNSFQQLNFVSLSSHKKKLRVKTSPEGGDHSDLVKMLTSKREHCKEITVQLKKHREFQITDFLRKTVKYQQLLDINDHKKKRLMTFNPKIGQVVKISNQEQYLRKIQYSLFTNYFYVSTAKPETREGHSTIIYQNNAVVLGGHCSHPFSQGHVYSFANNCWNKAFNLPSARSYHSTVLYKGRYAVVFGGMGPFDISRKCRLCYNTVNVIDLHSLNGKVLKMGSEDLVQGRKMHAYALMGKYMIVFGGISSKRSFLKDFVYLDLKELRWYQKEYRIDGKQLNDAMNGGIAKHKAVVHFRQNRTTFPLYSSQYTDNQGLYFFGGAFGNGNENILLFMALNSYNPFLRRITYSGTAPSPLNLLAEKVSENLVIIISGEVNDRMTKLFKLKQREFMNLYTYQNTPYLGGVGSTLNRFEGGLLILFGLTESGYSPEIASLMLKQEVKLQQTQNPKKQRRQSIEQWRFFRTLNITEEKQID